MRPGQARSVRQVAKQRHSYRLQAVARDEGPRAAVHALDQAEH